MKTLITLLAMVALVGCTSAEPDDNLSKDEARSRQSKGDTTTDFCAEQNWYGDGVCDLFCLEPDTDDCGGDGAEAMCERSCSNGESLHGDFVGWEEGIPAADGTCDYSYIEQWDTSEVVAAGEACDTDLDCEFIECECSNSCEGQETYAARACVATANGKRCSADACQLAVQSSADRGEKALCR